MRSILIVFLLAVLAAGPVRAESAAPDKTPSAQTVNPHIEKMNEKAKALAQSLTEQEAKDLGQIRGNFGVLRSIGIIRKGVGEAVSLCAEKNPDLSEPIKTRHEKWLSDINAGLEKQEKSLEDALGGKRFTDEKQVRDYLDTVDAAAEYADKNMEKTIVTTPEACTKLKDSMDETQGVILKLITDMTWPADHALDDDGNKGGEKTP